MLLLVWHAITWQLTLSNTYRTQVLQLTHVTQHHAPGADPEGAIKDNAQMTRQWIAEFPQHSPLHEPLAKLIQPHFIYCRMITCATTAQLSISVSCECFHIARVA